MLVIQERPGDLLFDRFFLLTSLSWAKMPGIRLLEHYRRRGKAEGHMGELKDVLDPALSSTNRPKSTCRGRRPNKMTPGIDAFGCNEVRWLVSLMAYELMHIARRILEEKTRTGWSLCRMRERVLRDGARRILSGCRMTLIVAALQGRAVIPAVLPAVARAGIEPTPGRLGINPRRDKERRMLRRPRRGRQAARIGAHCTQKWATITVRAREETLQRPAIRSERRRS